MSVRAHPLVLTAASLLAACSHHAPPATTPAPQQNTASAPAPAPAPVSAPAPAPTKVDDSAVRALLTQMTFFAYDRSELSSDDQTTLAAKVPILAANPGVSIRVDGNCDERGSDEYNLALGQTSRPVREAVFDRATASRIPGSRSSATVKSGRSRPATRKPRGRRTGTISSRSQPVEM